MSRSDGEYSTRRRAREPVDLGCLARLLDSRPARLAVPFGNILHLRWRTGESTAHELAQAPRGFFRAVLVF